MTTICSDYLQTNESLQQRLQEMLLPPLNPDEETANLIRILGFIDLTTLEGSDTEEKVKQLCRQARFSQIRPGLPDSAAVCVYPSLVRIARRELQDSHIRVASVAGGFPSGQTSLKIKLEEVRWAIGEGADEIDTVISRGKLIEGKTSEVYDEIAAIREVCGRTHLKVILETGELSSVRLVRQASALAIEAGADFIKTSTGKINPGASPEAFMVMLDTIREYLEITGKAIGIKPAGGIRTTEQALIYFSLVGQILGEDWLDPAYFRIGASSLAKEILDKI